MRWFVEISSLGKDAPPGTTLCVEASEWQPALQKARSLRGDDGALSNFSIELLDDGYRAIDPAARIRYLVRKAPDDAALTNGTATVRAASSPPASATAAAKAAAAKATMPSATNAASSARSSRPAPAVGYSEPPGRAQKTKLDGTRSSAPAPAASSPPGSTTVTSASEPPKKRTPVQTVAFGSRGAAVVSEPPPPVAPRPSSVPPASAEARSPGGGSTAPAAGAPSFEPRRGTGSYASPGEASVAPPGLPPSAVISSRHEEPSERSPLTYREFAYAVAEGTSIEAAESLLVTRLDEVRRSLEETRTGKLVNLAAFDHSYRGRPLRPAIATLSWKDWKGEAEIRFPMRDGPGNTPTVPRALKEPEPALPLVTRAADAGEAPVPLVSAKGSSDRPAAPAAAPASDAAPTRQLPSAPPPPSSRPDDVAVESSASTVTSAPPPAPPPPAAVAPPADAAPPAQPAPPAEAAAPAPAASARPQAPPSSSRERRRLTPRPSAGARPPDGASISSPPSKRLDGDELIAELFEASADLHFMANTLEGAEFVMALMREKIPSEVAVVSLFDINRREFVVVRQSGAQKSAVLARVPEKASIPQEAMRTKRAVVVADAGADQRARDDRWQAMGVDLRSLVCAPVEVGGRYLGLLELANPSDGGHFTAGDGHALTFIGQQFAEFVAERGVVVDADHVGQAGHLE